jgi:hypothetical protein
LGRVEADSLLQQVFASSRAIYRSDFGFEFYYAAAIMPRNKFQGYKLKQAEAS